MKNYLVGKIGKAIKFNRMSWGPTGGDCDAPILIENLAKTHPDDNFYLISSARDYDNSIPNIVSLYKTQSPKNLPIDFLVEQLKDIKIDGILLIAGTVGSVNIPEKIFTKETMHSNNPEYVKVIDILRIYVAQIYYFLNETMLPWLMISNDPRYLEQGRDLINPPVKCLSQYDEMFKYKRIKSYEDQDIIYANFQCTYSGVEKIFLLNNEIINKPKEIKFLIVLNEGKNRGVTSRYPELKKFVLDYIDDVEIYGEWYSEQALNDKRFKGPKKFVEIKPLIQKTKYTFIIPIKKGWVTAKYIEMISQGCLPFFHPDYDTQKHCDVPEFLRVKTPKELYEKIEKLEKNPDAYKMLIENCQKRLRNFNKDDFINNIVNQIPECNKPGKDIERIVNDVEEW